MITSKTWWYAAGIRALRTWAQTAAALIPVSVVLALSTDWAGVGLAIANIAGNATLAAVLSLLTSLGGLPEIDQTK